MTNQTKKEWEDEPLTLNENFKIMVSTGVMYFVKRNGNPQYCTVSKKMSINFPQTREGAFQALVTNYAIRKHAMDTIRSLNATLKNPSCTLPPVDVNRENCYQYNRQAIKAEINTIVLEFPYETVFIEVSFPQYDDCRNLCDFEIYKKEAKKYEFIAYGSNQEVIEKYEKQMRSLATIDFREDTNDPNDMENETETESKFELKVDASYDSLFQWLI